MRSLVKYLLLLFSVGVVLLVEKIECWKHPDTIKCEVSRRFDILSPLDQKIKNASESSEITWNGNWALGCHFNGNDLAHKNTGSREECSDLCDRMPTCTHFSWTNHGNGTCWLKKGPVSRRDAFRVANSTFACGISYFERKFRICETKDTRTVFESCDLSKLKWFRGDFAYGCEFTGNDLYSKSNRSADECRLLCNRFFGCTHFTWSPVNGGTCFLKSGDVKKRDARIVNDLLFVCGLAKPRLDRDTCTLVRNLKKYRMPQTPAAVSHCKPVDVFDDMAFSWKFTPLNVFNEHQFKVGIEYMRIHKQNLNKYGYVTMWMNSVNKPFDTYNNDTQIEMLRLCKRYNKTPVLYSYVIAFEARSKLGLLDCDVATVGENLCTNGSCFIRAYRQHLIDAYANHSRTIAKYMGRYSTPVFLIEPDFWQYYGDRHQYCPLNGTEMRDLFIEFVRAIKRYLPRAEISWDISSWPKPDRFCKWWKYFEKCEECDITYTHTSGGQSRAETKNIKPTELEWSFISELTGKKIIADCGYGVGGIPSDNCIKWKYKENLVARMNDGVIALLIATPPSIFKHKLKTKQA